MSVQSLGLCNKQKTKWCVFFLAPSLRLVSYKIINSTNLIKSMNGIININLTHLRRRSDP